MYLLLNKNWWILISGIVLSPPFTIRLKLNCQPINCKLWSTGKLQVENSKRKSKIGNSFKKSREWIGEMSANFHLEFSFTGRSYQLEKVTDSSMDELVSLFFRYQIPRFITSVSPVIWQKSVTCLINTSVFFRL